MTKGTYFSTKKYGHEVGLSCVFRQWRATSHCNQFHGYALAFEFTFKGEQLDERNWVVDFGGLKPLKAALEQWFDHTLVVAQDDPKFAEILRLKELGIADVRIAEAVGCEAFAKVAFVIAKSIVNTDRVKVVSVRCSEHGANSAIYAEGVLDV